MGLGVRLGLRVSKLEFGNSGLGPSSGATAKAL